MSIINILQLLGAFQINLISFARLFKKHSVRIIQRIGHKPTIYMKKLDMIDAEVTAVRRKVSKSSFLN